MSLFGTLKPLAASPSFLAWTWTRIIPAILLAFYLQRKSNYAVLIIVSYKSALKWTSSFPDFLMTDLPLWAGSYHHGIGGSSHHFSEVEILFSSSLWTKWGWKTFRGHGHAVGTCLLDSHWAQDIRCFPKGRSMTWKDDLIPIEIRFQLQTYRQSVACQFSTSLGDPSHSSWPGPFLKTWRTGLNPF